MTATNPNPNPNPSGGAGGGRGVRAGITVAVLVAGYAVLAVDQPAPDPVAAGAVIAQDPAHSAAGVSPVAGARAFTTTTELEARQ